MVFSYNWLQSFFSRKLPKPEILANLLTMHFAEVEEIKKIGSDFALDVDVRPNRAGDCFSHLGIAREIAAILNFKFQIPDSKPIESKNIRAKDFVSVEVRDKNACPRYTARALVDVKVGVSLEWLKERLGVCGLRPINNIVDIANYVMLETGQPLHAFDGKKIEGEKIIVRFAKNKEKIITLDGQKFDLNSGILVIADTKKPVAIAGIKGGKLLEIDNRTKVVVLESANFNPRVIRQGSKNLNLKTDASLRFEHGIDQNLTEFAIDRAAYLIRKIAGGKVSQGLVDVYPKKTLPKIIKLDLDYVGRLLGAKIPERKIRSILEKLDFKIKSKKLKILTIEVPTRRLDISLPEDLIEEIGRIYGYQKIPIIFPISSLIPPKKNEDVFWEDLAKDILKEAGLTEVYNYSFISEKDKKLFSFQDLVELENPLSEEQRFLRPSLIPNLLKNIQKNQEYFNEIRIFELGKVFEGKAEKRMLSGVLTGEAFYQVKGIIDLLMNKLGICDIVYDSYHAPAEKVKIAWWRSPKCAEAKISGEQVGFLGEIAPRVLEAFKIKSKLTYFDIFFEKLSKTSSEEREYEPISRFPAAIRDIAVLVPKEVMVEEVLNVIEITGGPLVRDTDLFDIYEGERMPENKKNLAFHIIYQAEDRTLSSQEIDEIQNKIIKALEANPDWQVRGR